MSVIFPTENYKNQFCTITISIDVLTLDFNFQQAFFFRVFDLFSSIKKLPDHIKKLCWVWKTNFHFLPNMFVFQRFVFFVFCVFFCVLCVDVCSCREKMTLRWVDEEAEEVLFLSFFFLSITHPFFFFLFFFLFFFFLIACK